MSDRWRYSSRVLLSLCSSWAAINPAWAAREA